MADQNDSYTLENLMIAAPCEVAWDDMVGDDRVRNCHSCQLNVYNIKELSRDEAEALLNSDLAQSGKVCMRLYRRGDGTIITRDCPRGLARIRSVSSKAWRWVAATILAALTGVSAMAQEKAKDATAVKDKDNECKLQPTGIMGRVKYVPKENQTNQPAQPVQPAQGEHPPHPELVKDAATTKADAGKAHYTASNLYNQGQRLERSKEYARAAEVYHQALTVMAKHKHDPKFHLKIETALSRVKAKAGIKQ